MPDEHGEPTQHHAFGFGQQPEAPIQRGLQRLLPRRRRAWPQPEQRQALVEERGGLLQAVGPDTSGGQLDRERHAVELQADGHDDGGFRVAELQSRAARHRAFQEQSGGGEFADDRRRDLLTVRGAGERFQPVDMLALDLKGLAARRQDVHLRRGPEDARRHRCHRVDEMLAGVEDQKDSLVPEVGDQAGCGVVGVHHQPQLRGHGRGHQAGIAQHAEVDKDRSTRERGRQVVPDRHRDRGLADAAGADDGDEA